MKKLGKLIQKNIKIILRSRISALIVIFGPLLIILLVGLAFNSSQIYNINIGVYSSSYSELTESFIEKMNTQKLKAIRTASEEACIDEVKQGSVHLCLVFPPDMKIEEGKTNELTFNVDYSKMNLIWVVLDTISTELSKQTQELSLNLTTILVDKLKYTRAEVQDKKKTLVDLTTANDELSKKLTTVDEAAANMDITFDASEFRIYAIKNLATELQANGLEAVDIAKDAVDLARDADVDDSLDETLNNLEDSLNEIENSLIRLFNSSTTNTSLAALLDNAEAKIEVVKSKLATAESAKTTTLEKLSEAKELLSSNLNSIVILQNTLNKIDENIGAVKILDAATIIQPITTKINPVIPEKTQLNYLFPGLIVMIVMFISLLLSTTVVVTEKISNAYFRNFITPTRDITFFSSIYITNMLILLLQLVIVIAIAAFFFKTEVLASLHNVAIVLLLIISFFTLIGMWIGYMFNSEETATLAAISLGAIFLLLSNMILPLESMPISALKIAKFNPFVISEFLLRQTVLFQSTLKTLGMDIAFLASYSLLIFGFIMISQKIAKKRFIQRYVIKLLIPLSPIRRIRFFSFRKK